MNALKQCLHYDPDSKLCLSAHRLVKNFDKAFAQIEEKLSKEDWRGVVKQLLTPGGSKTDDFWSKFEGAMEENVGNGDSLLPLVPPTLLESALPSTTADKKKHITLKSLPLPNASKRSIQRQTLVRTLCKSFTRLADQSKGEEYKKQMGKWCTELLTLEGCEEDVDGLVGQSEEFLAKEEFEEAVRVLEKAFEAGGRGDRNVCPRVNFTFLVFTNFFPPRPCRFTPASQKPKSFSNSPNKKTIIKS
jgi:DnaJ family protein C protein 3